MHNTYVVPDAWCSTQFSLAFSSTVCYKNKKSVVHVFLALFRDGKKNEQLAFQCTTNALSITHSSAADLFSGARM